jgi:DNA-binding MarR family transcriptional regulator
MPERKKATSAKAAQPAQTRWLDEDEQQTWRAFMTATRLLFERLDREMQRDADMPHAYYEILVRLSESPQRTLRMSELAAASLSSRSRLSHAVSRLEDVGWVRRQECPSDKRGLLAVLTEAGFAALAAAAPGHVESVRTNLLDPLSARQVAALREISETLLARLDESGTRGPIRATGSGAGPDAGPDARPDLAVAPS